jgi:hypothetical protein
LTAVSTAFDADIAAAAKQLPTCQRQDFHPLADVLGRSTVFRGKSGPVLTVYDACGKTVPVVGRLPDGSRVASFAYVLRMGLACRFNALVEGNAKRAAVFHALCHSLCELRMASKLPAASDGHMFSEFAAEHVGTPISTMRIHMLHTDERVAKHGRGVPPWFTYDPSKKKKGDVIKPRFSNVTGSRVA